MSNAVTTALVVRPVASKGDLRAFIELPFTLHGSSEQWVAPLRLERKLFLSKQRNPFFSHGEAEYFLAEREGKVVGRITAQIDHAFNAYHENSWGMFGFLEFEDRQETLDALLDAAAAWRSERGRERMVGPMDFQLNNKIDRIRVGFLGVRPEWQHSGAAALLYREHFEAAQRTGVKTGEMGWILETNKAMNRAMHGMNGKIVKRYRVYEQVLQDGVQPLPEPIPWDAD